MFNSFKRGMQDGMPIALGYLPVSFTFGMMAVSQGMPPWFAVLISMVNLTSAGQFAGLPLILSAASPLEMAMTEFIINLRYSLMSLSLTQKVHPSVSRKQKLLMSFGVTDEIFAVASNEKEVSISFFSGLSVIPYIGWAMGTLLGALIGGFLPEVLMNALTIAIYAMFIAIVTPKAKSEKNVLFAVIISIILSCAFYYLPVLNTVSSGLTVSICAILAAVLAAIFFPIKTEGGNENG